MTRPDLKAIKERCEKATAGPWHWFGTHWGEAFLAVHDPTSESSVTGIGPYRNIATRFDFDKNGWTDADFIAHARQDLPDCVAHIEALEGVVREYGLRHHTGCNSFHSWYPGGEGIQELQRGECDCGLNARLSELGLEK